MQTARVFELTSAKHGFDRLSREVRDEEIQVGARSHAGPVAFLRSAQTASRTGEPGYQVMPEACIEDPDVWPDDPDTVPLWRVEAESRAQITELDLVSYRTKREFLAAVAACEANLKPAPTLALVPSEIIPETVSTLEETFLPLAAGPFAKPCLIAGREPLPPKVAAQTFLAWLIATGRIGKWSHEEMADFYAKHCRENSLTPTPENVLREALKRLPGASKDGDVVRVSGKRIRKVSWSIEGTAPMKTRKPNEKALRAA
jgi:hypothetical protein